MRVRVGRATAGGAGTWSSTAASGFGERRLPGSVACRCILPNSRLEVSPPVSTGTALNREGAIGAGSWTLSGSAARANIMTPGEEGKEIIATRSDPQEALGLDFRPTEPDWTGPGKTCRFLGSV